MLARTRHRNVAVPILIMASLLSWICAATPSSAMFPLEVFGEAQNAKIGTEENVRQQILTFGYDNPIYSNSSFPGDETGGSPFFYCPESDPENDMFDISKIVLNPNPPHINYVWVFHAHGYFREAIVDWTVPFRVRARVKNESRRALDLTIEKDFCDFVDLVEMDGRSTMCPPEKGNATIHKVEFVDFGISEVSSQGFDNIHTNTCSSLTHI